MLASCLAEISNFSRFSYQSRKIGKTGWCWQKREKSSVRVPFQGLYTNRVLLIFFGFLPVATATEKSPLSPVTRQNAAHSLVIESGNSLYDLIISVPTAEQSSPPEKAPVNKEVTAWLRCSHNHLHPLKRLFKRSPKISAELVFSTHCRCLLHREAPQAAPVASSWRGRVVCAGMGRHDSRTPSELNSRIEHCTSKALASPWTDVCVWAWDCCFVRSSLLLH